MDYGPVSLAWPRSSGGLDVSAQWRGLLAPDEQAFFVGTNAEDNLAGLDPTYQTARYSGADEIWAGAGNDAVQAGGGDDSVHGGSGDDALVGHSGNDVLLGDEGKDRLVGDEEAYADIHPIHGIDVYRPLEATQHGVDWLDGGAGNDILSGGGRGDWLFGGAQDDLLHGDTYANAPSDLIQGDDRLDGGDGTDQLFGDGGKDQLLGGNGNDILYGDNVHDRVDESLHGADWLDGQAGNDQLAGGAGDDWLLGGEGDDILDGDDGPAVVAAWAHGNDQLDGGAGNDQLIGNGGDDVLQGGVGDDLLIGDDNDNTLSGKDQLYGGEGADRLFGGQGDDLLDGGQGHDFLGGEVGDDTLIVGDGDYADGGAGDDRFQVSGSVTLAGGTGTNRVTLGSGSGSGSRAVLADAAGRWQIQSAATSAQAITVIQDSASGYEGLQFGDTQVLAPSLLASGLEVIELADGSRIELAELMRDSDLAFHDDIQGSSRRLATGRADDVLSLGGSGNVLEAGGGNDTIHLHAGDNTLRQKAGDGADRIVVDVPAVSAASPTRIELDAGLDLRALQMRVRTIDAIQMAEVVWAQDTSFTVEAARGTLEEALQCLVVRSGSEERSLWELFQGSELDIQGSAKNDYNLQGTSHHDRIDAGAGSDTVYGQAGNDHLLGGAGWDTLYGGEGHDRLDGGLDADNLYGGNGNDLLQGGAGADQLDGGTGDDLYDGGSEADRYVDSTGDDIFVLGDAASGADTIELVPGLAGANVLRFASHTVAELSFNWVPGELLVSTVDGQALATVRGLTTEHVPFKRVEFADGSAWEGDALLQGLLSNPQGGVSLGGAGDDVLAGGEGRDLLLGRGGHDLLQGGAGDDELQGGEGHDVLHGGAGNDLLAGGAGDDWLAGGAGLDQLVGGSGLDTFVLGESTGRSVIRDDAAEANRIQLAPGVALGSLTTELRGGSLTVSAPGGSALQIADYGQQAQGYGAWAVRDDAGASTTLAALVAAIEPDDSLYGGYRAGALAEIETNGRAGAAMGLGARLRRAGGRAAGPEVRATALGSKREFQGLSEREDSTPAAIVIRHDTRQRQAPCRKCRASSRPTTASSATPPSATH